MGGLQGAGPWAAARQRQLVPQLAPTHPLHPPHRCAPGRWDAFFNACRGCRVDFMATHYYSCSAATLFSYMEKIRNK